MADLPHDTDPKLPPAEVADVMPPHAHGWWSQYVFSQDAKYIAIQYAGTATLHLG